MALDIAAAFADYYRSLYTSPDRPPYKTSSPLVTDLPLPRLVAPKSAALDLPITLNEVDQALSELYAGKTPGPERVPG